MKKILLLVSLLSLCAQANAIERLNIKKGNTLPVYRVAVVDSSGVAVDLTGCTVTASMRKDGNTVNAFTDSLAVVSSSPTAGIFEFYFDTTKTARVGAYTIQFTVTGSAGSYTIPAGTMAPITIEEKY